MYDDILKLADFFEKKAKTQPLYLYHGTNKKNLKSIMSQGLLANPTKRVWSDDPDAGPYQVSRQSLEGVYLTANFMTAVSSANNLAEKRDNPIILIVQVQPNSVYLDEDEIRLNWGRPSNPFLSAISYFESLFDPKEFKQSADEFVNQNINYIKDSAKGNLHPKLENRLREILFETAKASVKRITSYADDYDYNRAWDYLGLSDQEKPPKPNSSEAEREFKVYQDMITKVLKVLARYGDVNRPFGMPNVRLVDNAGFSGSNKIIAIIELTNYMNIDTGTGLKLIYPNNFNELPPEVVRKLDSDLKNISGDLSVETTDKAAVID